MWLITPIGFFSIVQKPGDQQSDTLTVRSRVHGDLIALMKHYLPGMGPIQESLDTDYRFRAVVPRAEVSSAMARMIEDLDYGNFKSQVAKQQGHQRAKLYHKVWDVLYPLQTSPDFVETAWSEDSDGGVNIKGKQVIVKVGSEGGSLTLFGLQSPEGWQFRLETNQGGMMDEVEDGGKGRKPKGKPWVGTWRSALKQLDAYPWTQLYALEVNPEFCNLVFKALQAREKNGTSVDWGQWGYVLNILVDKGRG